MIKKNEDNGTFTVQYSERHLITRKVKTLRRQAKTEASAKRIFRELIGEVKSSFEATQAKMLWPNLLDVFYEDLSHRGYEPSTVENYTLCLNAHTRARWSKRSIDSIDSSEIKSLIKEHLSDRSVSQQKNVLKYLRGAFNFAVERRLLPVSPVPRLQFRIGNKFQKALTEDHAAKFLRLSREMDHEWWRHWHFQIYTGLRSGEAYALRKANVDLANRQIRVVESWTKKGGFKKVTKTGIDRIVEIAPPLIEIFQELLELQQDSVFLLPRIGAWDCGRQAEILRTLLAGIGLPQITFHNLRSTWATFMMSKGVPQAQVMKLGGWTSIKTLNEHYLRLTGIETKGATDIMIIKSSEPAAKD